VKRNVTPLKKKDYEYFCNFLVTEAETLEKIYVTTWGTGFVFPSLLFHLKGMQKEKGKQQLELFSEKGLHVRQYASQCKVQFTCEELVHAVHDPTQILDYFEMKDGKCFLVLKGKKSEDYIGAELVWFGVMPPKHWDPTIKYKYFSESDANKNRYGPLLLKVKTKALLALVKPIDTSSDEVFSGFSAEDMEDMRIMAPKGSETDDGDSATGSVDDTSEKNEDKAEDEERVSSESKGDDSGSDEKKQTPGVTRSVGFKKMGTRIYKSERSHTTIVDVSGEHYPLLQFSSDHYDSGNPFAGVEISELKFDNGDNYPSAWDHPEYAIIDTGDGIRIPLENDNVMIGFTQHEFCVKAAKIQKNGMECRIKRTAKEAKELTLQTLDAVPKGSNKDIVSKLKTLIQGKTQREIHSNEDVLDE